MRQLSLSDLRLVTAKYSRIKLIEETKRLGKASALNKALAAATGDHIALIPADVLPVENNWLDAYIHGN